MPAPRVLAVIPGSPAEAAGVIPGDELLSIDGRVPRDVLDHRWWADAADPVLEIRRGGLERRIVVPKREGEALGVELDSAVFDRVRTCDNHCEFCFIYQLPKGMRPSLYQKDDDYRLSFLYGNFTTLTRFTEADLETVVERRLSPLHVSIHATDPDVRSRMLRNRRGAMSLRWLGALLDAGIEVHGQIVVCPGVNDGEVLERTLLDLLDRYPSLASVGVVPLGISRHSTEPGLRPHTPALAAAVIDLVERHQRLCLRELGRRVVFAADEYYLLADRPFPPLEAYEGCPQHENGIGMARTFEHELLTRPERPTGVRSGFFAWVDGAPAAGYRAPRTVGSPVPVTIARRTGTGPGGAPVTILTGVYGARVLTGALAAAGFDHVEVRAVENRFFGGNIAVTGLLCGSDLARAVAAVPPGRRVLIPDVCLSGGRFLDGMTPSDLPRPVEVVPTDGVSLRRALEGGDDPSTGPTPLGVGPRTGDP